jgi:hypothetical protein
MKLTKEEGLKRLAKEYGVTPAPAEVMAAMLAAMNPDEHRAFLDLVNLWISNGGPPTPQ